MTHTYCTNSCRHVIIYCKIKIKSNKYKLDIYFAIMKNHDTQYDAKEWINNVKGWG